MSNEVATRNDVGTSLDLTKGLNLAGLQEDQKQAVLERAAMETINLGSYIAHQKVDIEASAAKQNQVIRTARLLEEGHSDFDVSDGHQHADGVRTEISVSRHTNNGFLVVIVIIGIVLILVLAKAL
jgi:hypothetical protein